MMPDELNILRTRVQELYEEEKFTEIIDLLTDKVLEECGDAELYAWRARAHYRLEQDDEALLYAQKAVAKDDKHWMSYLARGSAWYGKGEYDKALADYNKAIELKPDEATAYYNRGNAWGSKGEYETAIADYNRAIELKPDYALAYYNRGVVWYNKEDYDKAIADYDRAIELKPGYADAYNNRGNTWDKKKDYDKALSDYNKAIELKPDYTLAYYNRGVVWYTKGEYDKAITDYNRTIELKPDDADTYYNRGVIWYNKRDYDKAIADYDRAIELKPDHADAYNNRGNAWYNKGDYDKAITDYNKTIELKPDDATAYNNRGSAWDSKRNYDKEIADYHKAIELKPDYALAYYNRATLYESLGEIHKAIDDYNKAIELNFNVSNARSRLGTLKERLAASLPEMSQTNITRVTSLVNAIRKKSEAGKETRQVVHYSKLFVADLVTKDCKSRLHYSNVIYMNDPQEGKTFLEYLDDKEIREWYEKSSYRNESAIFLGSFLPVNNGDDDLSESAEDQLLMWRTYGKDEKGNDAGGCNFVIDASFFETEGVKTKISLPPTWAGIEDMIRRNVAITDEDKNRLLSVQYIRKNKIVTDDGEGTIANLIVLLKEEIRKHIQGKDINLQADKEIFDSFQELCHLFKSADYSFEKEVRVIRAESRNNDNIEYYKEYKDNVEKEPAPPRHFYVRSEKRLLPYLKKIYLGPKVKDPNHWSLHFDYSLRKAFKKEKEEKDEMKSLDNILTLTSPLIDAKKKEESTTRLAELKRFYTGVSDLSKEEIKPNEIEIIPSKCRFV